VFSVQSDSQCVCRGTVVRFFDRIFWKGDAYHTYYAFCKFLLYYKFIRYFGIYHKESYSIDILRAMVMVFNATFNIFSVISWRSVLFGEGSRNTQRKLPTGHWQALSHNVDIEHHIALTYYAKIVHLLCQFHAGKVGFSAVCQAIYS
jgi:hypothetical protein